jgi:hypothetical protein
VEHCDAFVFFYAGHGVMSEGDDKTAPDFYLVPYDVVRIYGDDRSLRTNGIAARQLRELLKNIPAQKQLIVLDAGQADGAPADGKITVKELEAYLNDQVPELTKIYRKKRQDPNSSTRGQDFPIAIK